MRGTLYFWVKGKAHLENGIGERVMGKWGKKQKEGSWENKWVNLLTWEKEGRYGGKMGNRRGGDVE